MTWDQGSTDAVDVHAEINVSACGRDTSKQMILKSAWKALGYIRKTKAWSKRMRVELFPPDSDTEPRHWVRHDQAFAMMVGPGSIEWGSKRNALEKFAYAAGDLALCDRHHGEWVGL